MPQRVQVTVFLVGALAPGEDLAPGALVEVDDNVARDWVAKGWAVAVAPDADGKGE